MPYDLAVCLDTAALQKDLPAGCRVWWARGILVGHEVVDVPGSSYTHLQIADIDDRAVAYELRVTESGGDFADGDPVSILGHAPQGTTEFPRLVFNHNTDRWFQVFPLPVNGVDLVRMNQERDWLYWTGKPLVIRQEAFPSSWAGCIGLFLAGYVIMLVCIMFLHLGGFSVLVLGGAAYFVWWRWKKSRVNLRPVYQEIVSVVAQFALKNPNTGSGWKVQPRYRVS